MEESSIRKLLTSIKCSSCGRRYERRHIDVLGHHDDMWFLSVFCPSCRTQYLIVAIVTKENIKEVITDLTEVELDKFRHMGAVTDDEVLDMHSFLNDFDGNFSRLFEWEQV